MPSGVLQLYHHPAASTLAGRWRARFEVMEATAPPAGPRFYLWLADDVLELRHGARRGGVHVSRRELARRAAQGGLLARACGVRADASLTVLDALSGWGIDGLVLALRGCRVTMVERHPALCALAEDLARRSALEHVSCICGDGLATIADGDRADVIYLDPLFPVRGKDALPGKRLQWLAEIAEADPRPLPEWLAAAVGRARERVVLKRRRRDPVVCRPDWQIVGRTVRYDVFRGRG